MQPGILKDRPPYVAFEVRAEEDRNASIEAGYYKAKDVDYALITPAGSKDRVEQKVGEWFDKLQEQVMQERFPAEWLAKFQENYKLWKNGQEVPLTGTSVKNWPMLSPSQRTALLGLHVHTVEDLAAANEEVIVRLGMGGRSLRDKAREWLASTGGEAGKQAEQLVALRVALEMSENAKKALEDKLKEMKKQLEALKIAEKAE